jgi:pimeloyl-ACP methyl ester carboxylesterase
MLLPGKRNRLRNALLALLAVLAGGYSAALIGLYGFQRQLIFSGARRKGEASSVIAPPGMALVPLTTRDGTRFEALFAPALQRSGSPYPKGSRRPGLLFFYGNSSSLSGMLGRAEALRRCGVNVLVPEYVGYGSSGGSPSEQGCYDTADVAYDYLTTRPEVDPERLVVFGQSLGGGVAIDLASRRPTSGLITYGTFTSLAPVAQRRFWWAPVSVLLNQRFNSVGKIPRVRAPILMFHGTADAVIPFESMARLSEAAKAPVQTVTLTGGEHRLLLKNPDEEPLKSLAPWLAHVGKLVAPAQPASTR